MSPPIDRVVHFATPDDWRSVPWKFGLLFAPHRDVDELGDGDLDCLRMSFCITAVEPVPGADPIADLMTRRVRQGYPEIFAANVAGVAARGFGWTDGVRDILSWFARSPEGPEVEFCLANAAFQQDRPAIELAPLGRTLIGRITWQRR